MTVPSSEEFIELFGIGEFFAWIVRAHKGFVLRVATLSVLPFGSYIMDLVRTADQCWVFNRLILIGCLFSWVGKNII